MRISKEGLEKELKSRNIKLSYQRLKVLEFLVENPSHPTVDEIFTHLHKSISTLSKTTVYNTLHLMINLGLVRAITIEDNEARYEIEIGNHGHFKCEPCGAIYDFSIDMDAMASKDLSSFKINKKEVYFKGICPECLSKI